MQLVRYSPLNDLQGFNYDFDDLWQNTWGLFPALSESAPMDMYEEDGKLYAKVNLPNFDKKEVKVSAEGGTLEISAEHHEKNENKSKRRYYFKESSSRYLRRVRLPEDVEADKTSASFKDGILTITMPKSADKKIKPIEIK